MRFHMQSLYGKLTITEATLFNCTLCGCMLTKQEYNAGISGDTICCTKHAEFRTSIRMHKATERQAELSGRWQVSDLARARNYMSIELYGKIAFTDIMLWEKSLKRAIKHNADKGHIKQHEYILALKRAYLKAFD